MRVPLRPLVGALLAVVLGGPSASASTIPYGSISGTVINFDGLAGGFALGSGEVLANQFAGLGVAFNVPGFNAYAENNPVFAPPSAPNVIWVDQGGGSGNGININFSTPQSEVGAFLEGSLTSTFTLAVYNGATLLDSVTSSLAPGGAGLDGYLALQDPNITRAVLYSTNPGGQKWNFEFDDLAFAGSAAAVPEPTSLILLCLHGTQQRVLSTSGASAKSPSAKEISDGEFRAGLCSPPRELPCDWGVQYETPLD
jgi:hypothetical protein